MEKHFSQHLYTQPASTHSHSLPSKERLHRLNSQWIEELALEELNMNEDGIVNIHEHLDAQNFLEESGIEFVNILRDYFDVFVEKFNAFRGEETTQHIKVFKISNTVNDFMLFRNGMRLVINRKNLDVITIGFLSSNGMMYGARTMEQMDQTTPHEIRAHVGHFNNITWRYAGEIVEIEPLVRHYLSEFIRTSAC
jgi:hypothetical protein